ncbi:MAG: Na+/H+ antiporter NhaA [Phycisphaerales bacterium]|nr:Na+/H+ antiporter NhaA [Phycisphaerales bacterium]
MSDDHHIPTAAADLNPEPGERLARPFQRFASLSSSGGIILLLMTAIAMIWANKDYDSYKEIFNDTEIRITVADNPHDKHGGGDHGDGHHDDDAHDSAAIAGSDHADDHDDHDDVVNELLDETQELAADLTNTTADHEDPHHDDHHAAGHGDGWHPLPKEPHWYQGLSMVHWINDLLMAVFFLVVGLEIKREILVGELASPKRAALPIFGALGGMVGPALIFVAFNFGKETISGWGIPMATDIAFAVGILAMLGSRIPNSLKVFLTSLAIVDDLGALVVIAVFYTENLEMAYLGYAGSIIAVLMFMNVLRVRWITLYLVLGLPLWYCVYMSGVHATIAGVLLAVTIPAHARVNPVNFVFSTRKALDVFANAHDDPDIAVTQSSERRAAVNAIMHNSRLVLPPLHRMEHVLHPWAAFVIIPIFALANAGIPIHGGISENLSDPAAIGIILGLFVGKPVGIALFCMFACKIGIASLPRGVSWRHIFGAGMLGGIGFTMAIFIANLAYADSITHLEHAKLAILVASALSAIGGAGILLTCKSAPEPEPETMGPLVDGDEDDE